MPPRKQPAVDVVSQVPSDTTTKKKTNGAKKIKSDAGNSANVAVAQKLSAHPPTIEMVKEALKVLDSRRGSSVQAIRGYILENYPSVDAVRLKYMLRKALAKGLEGGVLVRPHNSAANGAQGRFRLVTKSKPKEAKVKSKENSDPNVEQAPKTDKAAVKKAKGKAAAATEKPKPTVKKLKAKNPEDLQPPKDTESKVPPAKKPKAKKLTGEAGQVDKVLKPVLKPVQMLSEAGKKEGATATKNRGKTK